MQCVDGQWTKLTLKCESKNLTIYLFSRAEKKKSRLRVVSLSSLFTEIFLDL